MVFTLSDGTVVELGLLRRTAVRVPSQRAVPIGYSRRFRPPS
jgi:hypothetical protein